MIVVNTSPPNTSLLDFKGDAIICPCDVELTRNSTPFAREVFAKAGPELIKECLAIGYCGIGNAVITKGYGLSSKHVIFLPVVNTDSPSEKINRLTLHQGLRSALTLANAYSVETLAMPVVYCPHKKPTTLFERLVCEFSNDGGKAPGPTDIQDKFTAVLTSVSGEFDISSAKEFVVYPAT